MLRFLGKRETIIAVALLSLPAAAAPSAQERLGGTERDEWQRPAAVFAALGVEPGASVADVGAGGGYFTDRLSEAVGPGGRVYAVDINERVMMQLHEWRETNGRRNVELVLGATDDPRLPYRSLDGVLIVNAYHEMGAYREMLQGIRKALRVGGRLVIVDNPPPDSVTSRSAQTERHNIAIELVERDLTEAGFDVVERQPGFIEHAHDDHTHRHWMLVAERPRFTVPPPTHLEVDPAQNAGAADFWCAFPGTPEELRERTSPPDSIDAAIAGGRLKLCYSRPSARDRVVMGEMVPFGEPWRTGANEASLVHLGVPMSIAGVRLEPGTYSFYTVPGPERWEVVFNRSVYRDGVPIDAGVQALDVARGSVVAERLDRHVETMTFRVRPVGPRSAELVLEWERTRVRMPVERVGGSGGGAVWRPA